MKIVISENYAELSEKATNDLLQIVKDKQAPVVCTASGDSPAGMYKVLVDKVSRNEANINGWYFLGLDEWGGMNGDNEGSCRWHLNNQLFGPLQPPADHIVFFDGKGDLEKECERIETFIGQHDIDVSIVGLGMNGHIGMNEPGTPVSSRTHISELDPLTAQVGQKYFKTATELKNGITLGIATLLESKHIFLIVSGSKKAAIVKEVLEGPVSEDVPATLFLNHANLTIYLDKEAAQLISQ